MKQEGGEEGISITQSGIWLLGILFGDGCLDTSTFHFFRGGALCSGDCAEERVGIDIPHPPLIQPEREYEDTHTYSQ